MNSYNFFNSEKYFWNKVREGVKKNGKKSGQADRLGRPPLSLPRSGQENVKNFDKLSYLGLFYHFWRRQTYKQPD